MVRPHYHIHLLLQETPLPVDPSMFPTWPAKSELATLKKDKVKEKSPSAPEGGAFHQNQVMSKLFTYSPSHHGFPVGR